MDNSKSVVFDGFKANPLTCYQDPHDEQKVLGLLGEVPFTNRFYDLCTGNLNNLWN